MAGETPWTAGPWLAVVDYRKKGDRTFVTAQEVGGRVVVCQTGFGHKPPIALANARLIAAAPCLYEALASIIHNTDYGVIQDRYVNAANAALAKARAQGDQP